MQEIHPTALISPNTKIGKNVYIGPYTVIEGNCVIEDNVTLKGHVWLDGNTTLEEGVTVWPGAVIGTKTQDLKFKGEKTFVRIGKGSEIREYATINSSCGEGDTVEVGENCLIMAYCHVAHNCKVGNHVIMSNNATLAGHVIVEDYAIIGGLSAIHQFARVGKHAMIGGMSRITHDILPFSIGAGSPYKLGGLNLVGLKRKGFSLEQRKALTRAFHVLMHGKGALEEMIQEIEKQEIEQEALSEEVRELVSFCRSTQRGICGVQAREKISEMRKMAHHS